MPKTATRTKYSTKTPASKSIKELSTAQLNSYVVNEITRLAEIYDINTSVLEEFAHFVIQNHKKKPSTPKVAKVKPLSLAQLKTAVYQHFSVKNTAELKKSGAFKMATDGMETPNLSVKEGWEKLYRKFVGVLPEEENQQGYGCINGINVFNYFRPWQVFGLDPQTATNQDVKNSYRQLSKIYHPDNSETGDAAIFDRLVIMYKSISAEA